MINIKNYREIIRTSNGDGTERVEVIGCKMIDGDNEIEANLVFPKVSEVEQVALADYTTNKNGEIFTIYIPD